MRVLTAVLVLSAGVCAAQPASVAFSVPGVDAPELAPRGPHPVGVRTLDIVNPGQVDILAFDEAAGTAPSYDRPLRIEVWYPAVLSEDDEEHTVYKGVMPGRPEQRPPDVPAGFEFAGKALRDAPPAQGEVLPLVVVSHGYPGSRTFLSYLTENLASKGYVVVAIDHTDSVFGETRAFTSTLLNRSSDQLFTIEALEEVPFLRGLFDASRVAIVGYSMGGYGALASAGAPYSAQGGAARIVPGGYFEPLTRERPRPEGLKAIVAIAPWGAQPPHDNWDAEGLAKIEIPSLFIVGDHDDISGYDPGVKTAFDGALNSERCLLVYENARHNIGGNPPPPEALRTFRTREFFDEPVWRKDRITAVNQHFVTAFLDLHLKGMESRRPFLRLAVERSNDGTWPLAPGEDVGGAFSDGDTYWKGFQRRWALGLQLHCADPAGSSQ